VTTTKVGPGQLLATLATQTNVGTSTNVLSSVRILSIANAAVQINGSPVLAGQTIALPAGAQQAALLVVRENASQASTVSFAVMDACGEWKSLVGGGPGAF
jgi:hypothetical protein